MRNIINPEVITPFVEKLKARYPKIETFIEQNLKNYLLKNESNFIEKDEFIGSDLWIKKIRGSLTPEEKSMFAKHGAMGTYLKLTLNQDAFEYYCHRLDYANNLDPHTLERMSISDLKVQARRVEKKAKEKEKVAFNSLQPDVDFRFVAELGDNNLYELITLKAYQMEGQDMRHCVGSYVKPDSAFRMYSLRSKGHKGIMTVHLKRSTLEVREARGKHNSSVDPDKLSSVLAALGAKPQDPARLIKKLKFQSLFFFLIAGPFFYSLIMSIIEMKFRGAMGMTGYWTFTHGLKLKDAYKDYSVCMRQHRDYAARQALKENNSLTKETTV